LADFIVWTLGPWPGPFNEEESQHLEFSDQHHSTFCSSYRTSESLLNNTSPFTLDKETGHLQLTTVTMATEVKDAKVMEATVERFESLHSEEMKGKGFTPPAAMGTVNLTDLQDIYLVPAPSADPRGMMIFDAIDNGMLTRLTDPLNLPKWRKVVFIVLLSICKQCLGPLLKTVG
jgi:hypothetical protein